MHLLPDPLFTISSDNAYLLHTVGTLHGRIFTGGKDGCLYEIAYQVGSPSTTTARGRYTTVLCEQYGILYFKAIDPVGKKLVSFCFQN